MVHKGLGIVISHSQGLVRRLDSRRRRVVGGFHIHIDIVRDRRAHVVHLAVAGPVVSKVLHPAVRSHAVGPGHEHVGLRGNDGCPGVFAVHAHVPHKSAKSRGIAAGAVPPARRDMLQHAWLQADDLRHGTAVGALQGHSPQGGIEKVEQADAALVGFPWPAGGHARLKVLQRTRHQAEDVSRQQHG